MDIQNSYKTNFPDSLRNAHNLQLGSVSLRYLGYENLPSLITIYELEQPAILAFTEIRKMIDALNKNEVSEYNVKGIFTLGISRFETMLTDLMKKYFNSIHRNFQQLKVKKQKALVFLRK